MFLFDLKDFRKGSTFAVPVTEETMLAALDDAGVEFKTPLSIRFRIKDMDARRIVVRADAVDSLADEFRLNVYIPPVGDDPGSAAQQEQYLLVLNAQIRHQLAHIRQARSEGGTAEQPPDVQEAWEAEAAMHALEGLVSLIPHLGEAPA